MTQAPNLRCSGLNVFHDYVKRDLLCRIVFEDAVGFIRPDILSGAWSPTKLPVAQSWGFRQIGFATPEFLRQEFVLCNIYADADSLHRAIV